jgi:hypothetical protein
MFGGDRYASWDGDSFSYGYINPGEAIGSTKAIWGTSANNFYIVGDNGSISHYNGTTFILMVSGTNRDLEHISGYYDKESGMTKMWAIGDYIVLYYNGVVWQTIWLDENPYLKDLNSPAGIFVLRPGFVLLGLWKSSRTYGYCFDENNFNNNRYLFDTDVSSLEIEGESLSDLFIVGSGNEVAHFNGSTIKEYKEISGTDYNRGVAYIDNNVFIVGTMSIQQGLFIRGIRY